MTRAEIIQTILRSELIQWRTMTKEQLIQNMLLTRAYELEDQSSDMLDYMCQDIDVAQVWEQAL
jgi:hypothetical protein